MLHVLTLTTQITTQRRATRPEITWQPPCSSCLDILPVMWCGAQSSTSTHASRWDPIWGCPGVSGRSEHFTSTTTHKDFTVIMCQRRFLHSAFSLVFTSVNHFFFFFANSLSVQFCLPAVAIQALRSVLNSFSVGNRKNMFVYQERTTKSVFYLRLAFLVIVQCVCVLTPSLDFCHFLASGMRTPWDHPGGAGDGAYGWRQGHLSQLTDPATTVIRP